MPRRPLARLADCLLATSFLSAALASPALAAPGDLDTSFGGDGRVTTNFTANFDGAEGVAIQADGKIVAAGTSGGKRFGLARYDTDGTLDPSFGGGDGKVSTDFTAGPDAANGVAIQADGKIVAAGIANIEGADPKFALARYNADGTLDTSFSSDGKIRTNFTAGFDAANDLGIQADGRIVAAGFAGSGNARFALARYDTDGTLDTSFGGGDGKVRTNFTAGFDAAGGMDIQANGKLVAAGFTGGPNTMFALALYNTDGTLDTSFSTDGKVTTNFTPGADGANSVAAQMDGKIVAAGLAGDADTKFALARYNADGTLDTSFSSDGKVRTNFTGDFDTANDLAIQADGKIVAAGFAGGANTTFALARYDTDGTLDTSFGGDGRVTTNFTAGFDAAFALALEADGKIVAAGLAGAADTKFALARYLVV
jgi:uncharacterized delta-60 repeat protein